ncbi:MAG TPA: putative selenate ABC transporter substrate-binding protein [bacterium]|nr:putative selenate ABC transporter substrate-binding protein [bacterium]
MLTRRILLALLLTVAPAFLHGVAHAQKTFVFTAIPDQDETRLMERFSKVATYLHEQLGVEVKYVPVKSYEASIAAFRNDQVQMAWFGGLSHVQAVGLVPGAIAIAQGAEDAQFHTYFIANASTGLKESDTFPMAMAGKTFTFGAKGSTSGRLMPEYYIRKYFQKAPEQVFERVGFSGDHNKTIALVESGAYQVGAVDFTVWESAVQRGKVDTSKVRVIWKTPAFQDYNFTIRGDLDQRFGAGFTEKLTHAILNMNDPALLATFPRSKIIPAKNSDYQAVYETAKAIGLLD